MAEQKALTDSERRHHNLQGVAAAGAGDLTSARGHFSRVVELAPDSAVARRNLGAVLRAQGRYRDARIHYECAAELQPDNADLLFEYGAVLHALSECDAALDLYRRALALNGRLMNALVNTGRLLCEMNRHDEARAVLQQAIRLDENHAEAHTMLARAESELGDIETGMTNYRKAIACDPVCAEGYYRLALKLRHELPDPEVDAMLELIKRPSLTPGKQFKLHYGLAAVYEGRGDYTEAWDHYQQANRLQKQVHARMGRRYRPESHRRFVERIRQQLNSDFFKRIDGSGSESERPVFIIGLPRSGTTLTEQIMASHPMVHGAGELKLAHNLFASLPEECGRPDLAPIPALASITRSVLKRLTDQYLSRLRQVHPTALRIVDKMPENYLTLGLIVAMFPRAKIIHCRRDLRDTALSCWTTSFEAMPWTCDIEHIRSHCRCYLDLMSHWRTVLPVDMLEIDYEQTVTDTESSARRLIAGLGLDWEPSCLSFHEIRRPILTASVNQVRKPVYRSSVGRWRHYDDVFGL